MYKGFKLEKVDFKDSKYYDYGKKLYDAHKSYVKDSLESFILKDNSLDGSKIIDSWFPQIKVDVFISHSHSDEKLAVAFAGWLFDHFGIVSFIDSCVWGYSNHLTKLLDDEYSRSSGDARKYDYEKVLYSTSHVHMMLSTALEMMIYKTECLFFLNTPHSVKFYGKTDKTESPWIYSELAYSQIGKQTIPERFTRRKIERRGSVSIRLRDESFALPLKVKYNLYSKHLTSINADTLNLWLEGAKSNKAEDALDKLYKITFNE